MKVSARQNPWVPVAPAAGRRATSGGGETDRQGIAGQRPALPIRRSHRWRAPARPRSRLRTPNGPRPWVPVAPAAGRRATSGGGETDRQGIAGQRPALPIRRSHRWRAPARPRSRLRTPNGPRPWVPVAPAAGRRATSGGGETDRQGIAGQRPALPISRSHRWRAPARPRCRPRTPNGPRPWLSGSAGRWPASHIGRRRNDPARRCRPAAGTTDQAKPSVARTSASTFSASNAEWPEALAIR